MIVARSATKSSLYMMTLSEAEYELLRQLVELKINELVRKLTDQAAVDYYYQQLAAMYHRMPAPSRSAIQPVVPPKEVADQGYIDPGDQWRHICLSAFENLPGDTQVTLADVDRVLTLGAVRAQGINPWTLDGAKAYWALCDEVAKVANVDAQDVDAILFWVGELAAAWLVREH